MKIGIPRSLLYFYYYPLWEELFRQLGIEIVVSDTNNQRILNRGVKYSISEICVPMKVYIGQVLDLVDEGVDYVYVPRIVNIRKGVTLCPKFLGLPDMIRHSLPGLEHRILTHTVSQKSDDITDWRDYREFLEIFDITRATLKRALRAASREWQLFRAGHRNGWTTDELLNNSRQAPENPDLTIGLLGYVYNVYDNYINLDLIDTLRRMNVAVKTFEMVDDKTIDREVEQFDGGKKMFWEFTNKTLGAGYHFLRSPEIDGVIHITAFGCGPDSILGPYFDIDSGSHEKPFMTLRIDEQTGESHLLTRVEAFVDLLKRHKKKQQRSLRPDRVHERPAGSVVHIEHQRGNGAAV